MKKYINILIIAFSFLIVSCDNVLDRQPLDIITDKMVWNDPKLIEANLLDIYSRMTFMYNEVGQLPTGRNEQYLINIVTDQATNGRDWWSNGKKYQTGLLEQTGGWEYWDYATIRKINDFLVKINTSSMDKTQKDMFIGSARFARAYIYFAMVKRFGGLPIILTPQSVDLPIDELQVPRSTEKQSYDYILAECDTIINNQLLPKTLDVSQKGYPTVYVAYALKNRAALYAASIARWGTVSNGGLTGIPIEEQNRYWQISYEAAQAIIAGPFSLYKKNLNDASENYRMLFIDEDNTEVIWAKYYDGIRVTNDWSVDNGLNGWTQDWLTDNICPYLEFIESFENADGTIPGKWNRTAMNNQLYTYNDLFGKLEPRFHAMIFTQGSNWSGFNSVGCYNGIRRADGRIIRSSATNTYNGIPLTGKNYRAFQRVLSGFGIKKGVDPTGIPTTFKGKNMKIQFRLGEILLNFSEAAYYLNKTDSALWAVNQIRARVNLPAITDISEEKIRHERKIELAFEALRHWDLKRWRTAVAEISKSWTGVNYVLDYTTGKFLVEFINNYKVTSFKDKHYYFPITPTRIANNPKLAPENPGY